jgi:hypothetical protein
MNTKIKGKVVIPLLNCIYITYHSIELSWTNSDRSQCCKLEWVGWLFLFARLVASNFKKIAQRWWGLVFPWVRWYFAKMHRHWYNVEVKQRYPIQRRLGNACVHIKGFYSPLEPSWFTNCHHELIHWYVFLSSFWKL